MSQRTRLGRPRPLDRRLAILASALFVGCASRPVAPPASGDPVDASEQVDASSSGGEDARRDAPIDEAPARDAATLTDGSGASAAVVMADEPIYPPGGRRRSGSVPAINEDDATVTRWNAGGSNRALPGTPPEASKLPHPAPRVKIDVVSVRGRLDEAELLRQVRSKGYWPIRQCYEAGLRRMQKLTGTARLRFSLDRRGRVREPKRVRAEIADEQVVACMVQAIGALALPPAPRAAPEILLDVALYPGDEPVYARTNPATLATDPESVNRTLRDTWPALRRCYADGLARDPELWGRLAVRMRVTTRGAVVEATEVESRFPDAAVTSCVCRALGQLDGLAMRDGTTFVYAVRFGNPRLDGGG